MKPRVRQPPFARSPRRYDHSTVQSRYTAAEAIAPQHHRLRIFVIIILLLGMVSLFPVYRIVAGHAALPSPEIVSGLGGYCLDDHHDSAKFDAEVDSWKCNGSDAQHWTFSSMAIKHDDRYCLAVAGNATLAGSKVVMQPCSSSVGQVWDLDAGGYQNPNSGLCLDDPADHKGVSLDVRSCNGLTTFSETWTASAWSPIPLSAQAAVSCKTGTEGERVACYAQQQWAVWQMGTPEHTTLLNRYTDGNAYEEWCADFVSYIYREAGHPFSSAEREGWDEYNADYIQNMGFTMHLAAGYVPRAGDVAYFNYPGGHVEIVVKGGNSPVFVFGDSGTIDPATNNGEMAENSLTSDGTDGQLVYYLSPN